jgi:hypothetical protein
MTRLPKLFRTPHIFDTSDEAITYFNENRIEGVAELSPEVCAFLRSVAAYDPEAVYNVQPAYSTHFVAAARRDDRWLWFYAKPAGVAFSVGDPRNVDAMLDYWDEAAEPPGGRSLMTDVWFPNETLKSEAAQFALRLAAAWAAK